MSPHPLLPPLEGGGTDYPAVGKKWFVAIDDHEINFRFLFELFKFVQIPPGLLLNLFLGQNREIGINHDHCDITPGEALPPYGERGRAERLTPPSREKGDYGILGFRLEFGSYFEKFSYLLLKIDG